MYGMRIQQIHRDRCQLGIVHASEAIHDMVP